MKYTLTPERKAFLDVIGYSEGTGDRYDILFGGGTFNDNGPHPNLKIPFGSTYSTAAGRYQFLYSTWQDTIAKLGIPDKMIPDHQDDGAMKIIDEHGALSYIERGQIESAINLLNKEWASFPGSPYGQPTKSMSELLNYYQDRLIVHRDEEKKNCSSSSSQSSSSSSPSISSGNTISMRNKILNHQHPMT